MKTGLLIFLAVVFICIGNAPGNPSRPAYYVDDQGTLRMSVDDTEASFFGVNYTMPFAHAYRAADYLGFDRKEAIDRDVYHFARLGFNAYRIHIWDVEISDARGNLLDNDHLDLLDYLIYRLDERGIKVMLTAMTNFGNGYPERNQPTGGFSYLYDKCAVHSDPAAVEAQKRYIAALASHTNPYTGYAYKDDPCVVAFEINNEPCHASSPEQTEDYINGMLDALAGTGNLKPVFYNVSHNMEHVGAYYNTGIDGTTYQWYPIGLVSGYTRKGNFLPYVDSYDIPFSNIPGFDSKAKAVYEFDPADIMYSYMYPAMARTFRSAGFQWITQFAYDPMDMAAWNTEYQTHYLNLAYTPGKAVSMKIAAEAAYSIPLHEEFAAYPADTLFGDFRVSYRDDLSEMNTVKKFFYSNTTSTVPLDARGLESVAGCGSSPVVRYGGTGAYFLDRVDDGVWRLEVMPDAVCVSDSFAKPSFEKQAVAVKWNEWPVWINIPDLGEKFGIKGLNESNSFAATAAEGSFNVKPGVYLLTRRGVSGKKYGPATRFGNIALGEYAAPAENIKTFSVSHDPRPFAEIGRAIMLDAVVAGPSVVDSVLVYPGWVSFWRDENPTVKMLPSEGYGYKADIPSDWLSGGSLSYNIVVFSGGEAYTFPSGGQGTPLDWDSDTKDKYTIRLVPEGSPAGLFRAGYGPVAAEVYSTDRSARAWSEQPYVRADKSEVVRFRLSGRDSDFFIRQYVKDRITSRSLDGFTTLCIKTGDVQGVDVLSAGFVASNGFTYMASGNVASGSVIRLRLDAMGQTSTALLPLPYPTFLKTEFVPQVREAFSIGDAETLQIKVVPSNGDAYIDIQGVWLE